MSVDKIPNMAAHGASNAQNGGNIKGGHGAGAGDASDPQGFFGALLWSLGVDDAEPIAATSASAVTPDAQPVVDTTSVVCNLIGVSALAAQAPEALSVFGGGGVSASGSARSLDEMGASGNRFEAFAETPKALAPKAEAVETDGSISVGSLNLQAQEGGAMGPDGGPLTATGNDSSSLRWSTKPNVRSFEQSIRSDVTDSGGASNLGVKPNRSQKEKVRLESVSAIAGPVPRLIGADSSKMELRLVGVVAEDRGRALAQIATEVLPLEVGQQTEFRRDRAIFKANSTTAGSDVGGISNGLDARPNGLSLEGMAPDVGAGLAQGDQNSGSYWMSGDMKSAEMKLEGFGENPVEVSISVDGNQAHVAFRTDEAQTRLALEDAGATLKDMLSKEGLNLTGVSVGTSAAGGDGAHEHRPRQDNRLTRIANLASKFPSGTSGNIVSSRVGQLDIFV